MMAMGQVRVLLFLWLLVVAAETASVPVYGRYETCVASEYQNPFNYTEVFYFYFL